MSDSFLLNFMTQAAEAKVHLLYLKHLYNTVELVDTPPEWPNCCNIATENIESNLNVVLISAANYLQRQNKVAIKIAQMPNCIFIKMENSNA